MTWYRIHPACSSTSKDLKTFNVPVEAWLYYLALRRGNFKLINVMVIGEEV